MKERPILFSSSMIRAILSGAKTQTRRAIKRPLKHPDWTGYAYFGPSENDPTCPSMAVECGPDYPDGDDDRVMCPFGAAGDQLWVRETFCPNVIQGRCEGNSFALFKDGAQKYKDGAYYPPQEQYAPGAFAHIKWKPSIFLPRWASRITLEIESVRVERLNAISGEDAQAEGWPREQELYPNVNTNSKACDWFRRLWDSINGKTHPWSSNPWVFVISFRRISPPAPQNAGSASYSIKVASKPAIAGRGINL